MDKISAESMAVVDRHLSAMGTRNINTILSHYAEDAVVATLFTQKPCIADSDVKPAGIPINIRPPFRFEAGHDSNQLPAGFRH